LVGFLGMHDVCANRVLAQQLRRIRLLEQHPKVARMKSSISPKQMQVVKWSRYVWVFVVVFALVLILGPSILPKSLFATLLVVLFTAFVVIWTWGATVLPPAVSEQMREVNYHPDADVRALQKGEITIAEYARRKADVTPPAHSTAVPPPTPSPHAAHQTGAPAS
jgi:hypothetical protein